MIHSIHKLQILDNQKCKSFLHRQQIRMVSADYNAFLYISMMIVNALFKQEPLYKQLKKNNVITDDLSGEMITSCLKMFRENKTPQEQQKFLKILIRQLEQKGSYCKKIKIMMVLLEISKISNYDVTDTILNKRIKVFIKPSKFKHNQIEPKPQKLQEYICQQLLIPLYNYQMKLSTNEELFLTCKKGQIPHDEVFRRGSKIRFIWIFKLYNMINILLPILDSIIKLNQLNPNLQFFHECAAFLFNDMVFMNNFVVKALEQASTDNFVLMPYLEMLQFHQSLKQQLNVGSHVIKIYESIIQFTHGLVLPMTLEVQGEQIQQIEIQALRVKLISNSLKNPRNNHKILQTEYNDKIQMRDQKTMKTVPSFSMERQDFKEKWKHLD